MSDRGPSADPYAVATFEAFWPHYVALHTRPETHVLHAVATLSCLGLLGAAVIMRQPLLALAAPLVDYAVAQTSHRLFEANRTTPWRSPLWHTRAELRMLRLVLTGRMAREVDAPHHRQPSCGEAVEVVLGLVRAELVEHEDVGPDTGRRARRSISGGAANRPFPRSNNRSARDQVQMAMVRTPARLPDGVRPTMRTETATPSTWPCRPLRPK